MKSKSIVGYLLLLAIAVTITFLLKDPAEAEQSIQKIETRPGVTVRVMIQTPETAPKGTLLIFPGSYGKGQFSVHNGHITLGANFLVRTSPVFVKKGFIVAIVDVPSDHEDGMSDNFRESSEHAQDIRKIIESLKEKKLDSFFLVGTSRGTISVAYLATVLKDEALKGVVLTSTMGISVYRRVTSGKDIDTRAFDASLQRRVFVNTIRGSLFSRKTIERQP